MALDHKNCQSFEGKPPWFRGKEALQLAEFGEVVALDVNHIKVVL
jgi:hypothetical protein